MSSAQLPHFAASYARLRTLCRSIDDGEAVAAGITSERYVVVAHMAVLLDAVGLLDTVGLLDAVGNAMGDEKSGVATGHSPVS